MSSASDTRISTAALLFFVTAAVVYFRPRTQRLPPGPKPLPVIGNLLDFPIDAPELVYDQWKEKYGDIIYMNVMGTPMVILNSLQVCNELFDKRSIKYSSRPRQPMLGELMGWISTFVMMPYSERWRKHRRLFHQNFHESASLVHRPIQQHGTYALLQRLYKEPEQLLGHLRLLFGETITEVMYGLKITGPDDVLLTQPEAAFETIQEAAVPGRYLVDIIPALRYVPSWLPGAGFKRQAAEWFKLRQKTFDTPFLRVKEQLSLGTAHPCVVTSMLSMCEDAEFKGEWPHEGETSDEAIKGCAANAYLAGADTTLSSMQAFFVVMANYPDVQKAAQKELDSVLGDSRLPTFEDAEDLPFIKAIVRELVRWHSATPLGVPHCLSEDDEYNGYILRKGTIVLGNTWSFSHDPQVYPEPLKFNPWRWTIDTPEGVKLNESIPDTSQAAFGFGRRICPGRHFAQNALFITIASVLTCFNIQPLDANGHPADRVSEEFSSGQIRYPKPFKVSITPRSDNVGKILRDIDSHL